jgi:cell division septum initiation protein DivIVA
MTDDHREETRGYVAPHDPRDVLTRSLANALGEIALTMNDLTDRIEQAADAIQKAMVVGASGLEIARLFVRAQQFIDRAIREAQREASRVLADAHAEAERIVAEERRHTRELLEQIPLSGLLPAEAVQQVARSIDTFTQSNSELTEELTQLRSERAQGDEGQGPQGPGNGAFG